MSCRGSIGYQYPQQTNNDIRVVPYMRQPSAVMENQFIASQYGDIPAMNGEGCEMDSEGIMDIARGILKAGKTAGKFLWKNK